ncbi:MAG: ABC transporter ATP-binding protein [Candidatus Marinimicrobia bacterium]|nr:ABC transporter ATP-binding protein [Candidatus Neomarinimicrobiota bacterium]
MSVLSVKDLSISYQTDSGPLQALRRVSFDIDDNNIVGIVGESGCGKSTLIGSIIKLLDNNAIVEKGEIFFQDKNIISLSDDDMKNILGVDISVIFQDPMQAHNPVLTIGQQMIDIQYRDKKSKKQKQNHAIEMLRLVGMPDPESRMYQYPHEFSGGMRQRIAIAMALMVKPALLIADEPTTALDATLEVQIIQKLKELQKNIHCSILFVSHHLGVIAELCDEVIVMYAGEIVESGSVRDIFHRPKHPYTQALFACDPGRILEKSKELPTIEGEIPNLINLPKGCIFKDRCSQRIDRCDDEIPSTHQIKNTHMAKCHLLAREQK